MAIMNNMTRIFITRDNVLSADLVFFCFAHEFDALLDGVVMPSLLRADVVTVRFRAAIVIIPDLVLPAANNMTQLFSSQAALAMSCRSNVHVSEVATLSIILLQPRGHGESFYNRLYSAPCVARRLFWLLLCRGKSTTQGSELLGIDARGISRQKQHNKERSVSERPTSS